MYLFQFPQIMFPIHDRLYCCQGAVYQRLREMIVPFWVPSTFLANSVSFMRNSLPTGPPLTVPVNVVTIIMLFARYYFPWASFVETQLVTSFSRNVCCHRERSWDRNRLLTTKKITTLHDTYIRHTQCCTLFYYGYRQTTLYVRGLIK